MSNRAFRRMIERRRVWSNYPADLPGEHIQEEVQTSQTDRVWNPEKEVLDNLRSVWYNFKNAETEEERSTLLKTIDKILSK